MDIVLIGRHESSTMTDSVTGNSYNVTYAKNVTFDTKECMDQIHNLCEVAKLNNSALVLQATPGFVAVAITKMLSEITVKLGVVVSKPAPHDAGKVLEFATEDPKCMKSFEEVVLGVNPNTKITIVNGLAKITVDPVMKYEFDYIEWFN